MKISEKERMLFDYMQEQANNLFDYCKRNEINLENIGFYIDPPTGYANIAATGTDDGKRVIYTRDKSHNIHGGEWDTNIRTVVYSEV